MPNPLVNMCRTCMLDYAEETVTNSYEIRLISIFMIPEEVKEKNLTYRELIKRTVPQLKIEENDEIPKSLCNKCSEKILVFYNFQKKSLESENQLYKLLKEGDKDNFIDNPKNQEKQLFKGKLNNFSNEGNFIESIDNVKEIEGKNSKKYDDPMSSEHNESNCEWNVNNKITKRLKKTIGTNPQKSTAKSKKPYSKEVYSCDRCQRKLKSKLSLLKHIDMHTKKERSEKELKCSTCNQAFQEITMFKNHQQTHTSEKAFLCSECGKGFTSAGSLKQHSFRHLDKKLYACSDCPKSFPTNGDLRCHYEIHKAKPRIHVCEVCGRGFYKPFLLKQHQRYHNDERPFACEFCEKRFITSEKQRRHMRTHTGEKPYRCKYCDRAFAQSNDCIKHLRQHLGDNVYQCELCPLRFPLARDLRVHFASHKDEDDETRSRNLSARKEEERNLQTNIRQDI